MLSPRALLLLRGGLVAVIVAAVVRFALQHIGCLYDDAYIYFRYVRVARDGCFYCFNPGGSRVEGVTSPLHFLSLLVASWVGVRLTVAATVLGALGVAAAIAAATLAPARLSRDPLVVAAASVTLAALCSDDWFALNAVSGLETATAMALVTLAACSALTRGHPGLGALCVLASLARPEALLLALLLPLLPEMRRARRLVPVAAALAAVVAGRVAMFHDVVPNTYHAKAGGTFAHARMGLRYVLDVVGDQPLVLLAPLILLVPEARVGGRYVLSVALVWFAFFLRSGGDHFMYGRAAAPILPALILLAVVGALDRVAAWRRVWVVPAAAALFALTLAQAIVHRLPPQHGFDNVRRWARLGVALRGRFPGATLATVPIGAIGYHARARLIDLVGLTEPRIARAGGRVPSSQLHRGWIGHERHDTAWVLSQRPDVIVTTRWRARPWVSLMETRPGFYADRRLWEEAVAGRAPYDLLSLEVTPVEHWFLLVRRAERPGASPGR